MKEKLTELIKQAKYCTAEELAEYLISAGLVLPTRCKDCEHGLPEDYKNLYTCANFPDGIGGYTNGCWFCSFGKDREIDFDYNAEDV